MIKDFLKNVLGVTGKHLGPIVRRLDTSVTVFLLHDVADDPAPFTKENDISLSTEQFRTQMQFIASNFNVVPMASLLSGDVPPRAALITFDDGYQGVFKNAFPILNTMGLPSTIFLNMAPILGENFWAERVFYLCRRERKYLDILARETEGPIEDPYLQSTKEIVDTYERQEGNKYLLELPRYIAQYGSLEDLHQADADPLITLGSHLYTHFNVKNLSDTDLKEQYEKNSTALSGFAQYLPVFAFPFGQPGTCFTPHQASYLLNRGAIKLFTTRPQPNENPAAKIIDRIALRSWHDCSRHLWYSIVRGPAMQLIGKDRSLLSQGYPEQEA